MKTGDDNGKKYIKMEDKVGGHYGIIPKTKKEKKNSFFCGRRHRNPFLRGQSG